MHAHRVVGAAMLALVVGCTSAKRPPLAMDRALALVNVTVVPMDREHRLQDQTVLIRDGVIAALGPADSTAIPPEARRVDGRGLFVLPGLVDAHVHLRDDSELLSYLTFGVTTIMQMSGPTGNVADVLALRDRINTGVQLGPQIFTTGRIIDGDPPIYPGVSTVVRTANEAASAVAQQLDSGVDFIKVYNNLRAESLNAVTHAAHGRGVSVFGHVPRIDGRDTALQRALEAGLDVIAHGEEVFFTRLYADVERQLDEGLVPRVSTQAIEEAVSLIRSGGAAVVPNLSFIAGTRAQLDDLPGVLRDPETRFLDPPVLDLWRQQNPTTRADLARFDRRERGKQAVVRELTRALHRAGVALFAGSDASAPGMFPGRSIHTELRELVGAGLTPYEALATATRVPAAFVTDHVRGSPRFGVVATGQRADLLVVKSDPLTDIAGVSAIAGVVVNGSWHTAADLTTMRRAHPSADTPEP